EAARALGGRPIALVESEHGGLSVLANGSERILDGQRRLADAGGADKQSARAAPEAPAQQCVKCGDAAGLGLRRKVPLVLGSHKTRIDLEAAGPNHIVVIATAKVHAAEFDD